MDTDHGAPGPAHGSDLGLPQAGPTMVRILLGGRLHRLRQVAGKSREEAGAAIRGSSSKICRLELGRTGCKRRDVADLLTLYGVGDQAERDTLLALAEQANMPGWVRTYKDVLPAGSEIQLELEQSASVIRGYGAHYIPGLLQTPDYARDLARLNHSGDTHDVERHAELVVRRQQLLHRPQPAKVWVVLDEAALRRRPGSDAMMRHQVEHLIEITSLPHVTVQVLPFLTGLAGDSITLLRFDGGELADVICLEQSTGTLYPDKRDDIDHYAQVINRLSVQATQPTATATILHKFLNEI